LSYARPDGQAVVIHAIIGQKGRPVKCFSPAGLHRVNRIEMNRQASAMSMPGESSKGAAIRRADWTSSDRFGRVPGIAGRDRIIHNVGMNLWTDMQAGFLRGCGVDPDSLDPEPMRRLWEALVQANRSFNLTRITNEEAFWTRHVLDSLSIGRVLPDLLTKPMRVADVGCGAGFPLLVLGWANPRLTAVGVESSGRKADFVADCARELALGNVEVLAAQARESARREGLAGAFDAVVLRAVGRAGRLLRDVRGLLGEGPDPAVAFYKTPSTVAEEGPLAEREAGKFDFVVQTPDPFELPDGSERQFLLFRRRGGKD